MAGRTVGSAQRGIKRTAPGTPGLTEKQIEHMGDKLMFALGFSIIRFSQPRNTMQTPGIPDRLYLHEGEGLAVWWEAKTAKGVTSYAQQEFQRMALVCGHQHVLGTDDALLAWCRTQGLVQ